MTEFEEGVTVKDSSGLTPLMYAVKNKHPQSVNFLTGHKSNYLNEEDNSALTILMHTMFENNQQMARKLLKRGADINYVNSNGKTCLS